MKLTQKKLRQIIKEELARLVEAPSFGIDRRPPRGYHDPSSLPSRAELGVSDDDVDFPDEDEIYMYGEDGVPITVGDAYELGLLTKPTGRRGSGYEAMMELPDDADF